MLFKRRQKKSAPFSFFGARTAGTKMSFTRVILLMVGLRTKSSCWSCQMAVWKWARFITLMAMLSGKNDDKPKKNRRHHMEVSQNEGTSKSSIFIGISWIFHEINHPAIISWLRKPPHLSFPDPRCPRLRQTCRAGRARWHPRRGRQPRCGRQNATGRRGARRGGHGAGGAGGAARGHAAEGSVLIAWQRQPWELQLRLPTSVCSNYIGVWW